jgi:hypothetical protein
MWICAKVKTGKLYEMRIFTFSHFHISTFRDFLFAHYEKYPEPLYIA